MGHYDDAYERHYDELRLIEKQDADKKRELIYEALHELKRYDFGSKKDPIDNMIHNNLSIAYELVSLKRKT